MKKSKKLFIASTALIPLSMFSAGESYAITSAIPIAAEVVKAISLTGTTTLNFGNIFNTTTGTVTIAPSTGNRSFGGSLTGSGGSPQAGSIVYNGSNAAISVSTSAASFNITNGSDTWAVNTFHINGDASGSSITIATPGTSTTILIGGTLNITSVPSLGSYTGSLNLVVDYQ